MGKIQIIAGVITSLVAMTTCRLEEYSVVLHTRDGEPIEENITVTETEEDITLRNGTRFIYDFQRGLMVVRDEESEAQSTCYVAIFERKSLVAPPAGGFRSKIGDYVDTEEVDYYVDRNATVERNVLSERAQNMCADINIYFMTTDSADMTIWRRKRRVSFNHTFSQSGVYYQTGTGWRYVVDSIYYTYNVTYVNGKK